MEPFHVLIGILAGPSMTLNSATSADNSTNMTPLMAHLLSKPVSKSYRSSISRAPEYPLIVTAAFATPKLLPSKLAFALRYPLWYHRHRHSSARVEPTPSRKCTYRGSSPLTSFSTTNLLPPPPHKWVLATIRLGPYYTLSIQSLWWPWWCMHQLHVARLIGHKSPHLNMAYDVLLARPLLA